MSLLVASTDLLLSGPRKRKGALDAGQLGSHLTTVGMSQ